VRQTRLLLPFALIGIQPTAVQLGMSFHVLMLRHFG
jgi:hypothetical protein